MNTVSATLQIVPIPALGLAVALIEDIWTAVQTVQSNKAQCLRLGERAKEVLVAVNDAVAHQVSPKTRLPDTVQRNVQDLESTLRDIKRFLLSLSNKSFIRQFLDKAAVSDKLTEYNQRLETCCTLFTIRAVIGIQGWLAEDRRDRETDTAELHDILQRGMQSGNAVIQALQIKQYEMLDAMLAIHNNMDKFGQGTLERRFAEHGLATLQRRSGSSPGKEPDWIISGFDLTWEEQPFDSGAFGDVFRGRWSGTEVAVKLLRSDTPKRDLRSEVEIWQKLRHPHIHRFFGCSFDWDPPFIVSELCVFGNALTYMKNNRDTNVPMLAWEIACGMQYLHSKNIVHGDLKAANVLISERRSALITDFGLSKLFIDSHTQSPGVSGADRWKSPETLRDGVLSKKADGYSWGMTVWELFTERPPFGNVFDIVAHVVEHRQTPERPTATDAPALSEGLWKLMQESWAWDPDQRPTFIVIADRTSRLVPPPIQLGAAIMPVAHNAPDATFLSSQNLSASTTRSPANVFHFAGRYTSYVGSSPLDQSPCKCFIESTALPLNLSNAVTISAWARRGSIVPRTAPPTQPRFIFSLEAESENARSIVAVGLEGGKHEPPLFAWLWPRSRDTGYTVLRSKTAMPARGWPRAEWIRTMWVHIAVVWDEHMARLYMNGELHDSAQIVTFENKPKIRLVIGRGIVYGKAAYQWDGLVENLKVSQSAWSSAEIEREISETRPSLQGSGYAVQPYEDPY